MPENDREETTVKQLAMSNVYQLEALINVVAQKGLLTSDEVLEELVDSDEVLEELVDVVERQKKKIN